MYSETKIPPTFGKTVHEFLPHLVHEESCFMITTEWTPLSGVMIGVGKGLETPKASRSETPKAPSAESVEGIGMGKGFLPFQPTGESHELPAGVRGRAPAENGF